MAYSALTAGFGLADIYNGVKGLGLYVLGILTSLGINSSVWPMMGLFVIALIVLSQLIFKPYLAAYTQRELRTSGGEAEADQLNAETVRLQGEYDAKAKELNREMRSIFDEIKLNAVQENDARLAKAHAEFEGLVKKSKALVDSEFTKAQESLSREVPELSKVIVDRLMGKST